MPCCLVAVRGGCEGVAWAVEAAAGGPYRRQGEGGRQRGGEGGSLLAGYLDVLAHPKCPIRHGKRIQGATLLER